MLSQSEKNIPFDQNVYSIYLFQTKTAQTPYPLGLQVPYRPGITGEYPPPPPTECQMNWNHHTIHKHTLNLHKLVCGRDELYFLYFTDQKIIFKALFQIIL